GARLELGRVGGGGSDLGGQLGLLSGVVRCSRGHDISLGGGSVVRGGARARGGVRADGWSCGWWKLSGAAGQRADHVEQLGAVAGVREVVLLDQRCDLLCGAVSSGEGGEQALGSGVVRG